jgi:hypothetical protein
MKMTFRTAAIAASAFACAALMSPTWSEEGGLSLSVENAQARVGRPLTPVSVAGVARRQTRRAVYGAGGAGAGAYAAGAYYGGAGPYAAYPTGPTYTGSGYACRPGTLYHGPDGLMQRCK